MCQVANESKDDATPKAYMISILFMLAVPATLFTGFGIGFYGGRLGFGIGSLCHDQRLRQSLGRRRRHRLGRGVEGYWRALRGVARVRRHGQRDQ